MLRRSRESVSGAVRLRARGRAGLALDVPRDSALIRPETRLARARRHGKIASCDFVRLQAPAPEAVARCGWPAWPSDLRYRVNRILGSVKPKPSQFARGAAQEKLVLAALQQALRREATASTRIRRRRKWRISTTSACRVGALGSGLSRVPYNVRHGCQDGTNRSAD